MQIDAEVIVIGAGIAGAGVASELAVSLSVILLEQEGHPGFHATGHSAALHSEIYGNASIRALTRSSRAFFLAGDDGRPFMTGRGCVHIATAAQLTILEAAAAEPSIAAAVKLIDEKAVRDLVPVLKPGQVTAALLENHAYDLDVDAIHRFFLKRLRELGGVLHCSTPASGCIFDGKFWTVLSGDRTFRAPLIVNAAGAWGDGIAAMAGAQPVGLQPKRRTALIVKTPDGVDSNRWPAVVDIGEQFYFKPEAGQILMSPADETLVEPHDAYADELDLAIAVERVQQVADIPVRRVEHSWAGLHTFAPDKTPVVGYDTVLPGFFWLTGQGGYGIQTAPALSRLAAALVRHDAIPADLAASGLRTSDFSPARLQVTIGPSRCQR